MNQNYLGRPVLIKKLMYRACHRGTLEADFILGHFAKANLQKMTDSELESFSAILDFSDPELTMLCYSHEPIKDDMPEVRRLLCARLREFTRQYQGRINKR